MNQILGILLLLLIPIALPIPIIINQIDKHNYWGSLRALIIQGSGCYAIVYASVFVAVYLWTKRLSFVTYSTGLDYYDRPNFFDILSYLIFCLACLSIAVVISFVIEAASEAVVAHKISKQMPTQLFALISGSFYFHAFFVGMWLGFS